MAAKREDRKAIFDQVPDHFKDMVWDHCVTAQQLGGKHANKAKAARRN
jgi:hypothetical protein